MKKIVAVLAAGLFFATANSVQAAPIKTDGNENIVANYDSGLHGIPGDPTTHVGQDVVMQAGKSGNFQQWFVGTHSGESDVHGHHSLWKYSPDKECKDGETEVISTPGNYWGDYLVQGERYCVKTNDFKLN